MRLSKLFSLVSFLTIAVAFVIGTGYPVSGQGKGHGGKDKGRDGRQTDPGDRGNKGENGQRMDRGDHGNGRGQGNDPDRRDGKQRQAQREMERSAPPQIVWQQQQRRQPQIVQQWPDNRESWQQRGNKHDRGEKDARKFEKQERKVERQEQRIDVRTWGQQFPDRSDRRRERRERDDRIERSQRQGYPQYIEPSQRYSSSSGYGSYRNYGQYRSEEVHRRNDRRKNGYDSDWRYDQDWSDRRPYGYSSVNRDVLRDNILRAVVSQVFNGGGAYYPIPQSARGYDSPYNYVDRQGYDATRYTGYPADARYRNSPIYADEPFYADDIVENLGGTLANDSSVGGFVSRIFRELLAYGYNDGYQAGQYARSSGANNNGYSDPYGSNVYDNVSFDNANYSPYSSLAENRRYVSEGYELGYQDGLREQSAQNEFGSNNAVDLVSMLLGNVL